jgi:hypothetical protein
MQEISKQIIYEDKIHKYKLYNRIILNNRIYIYDVNIRVGIFIDARFFSLIAYIIDIQCMIQQ